MKSSRIFIFIFISIFFIVLDSFHILGPFHSFSNTIVSPVKKILWDTSLTIKQIPDNIRQISVAGELIRENRDLKRQNDENTINIEILTDENKRLREQLESPLPPSFHFITASVLGISHTMDLAVGERDGVGIGMPVVVGTSLVGKIGSVTANRSSVILLTDSDVTISAQTDKETKGLVGGLLGQSIKMDKILQKDLVLLGEMVVTSGEDGLPPNLIIGKVKRVQADDVSVYKKAEIEGSVDPQLLKTVFVINKV